MEAKLKRVGRERYLEGKWYIWNCMSCWLCLKQDWRQSSSPTRDGNDFKYQIVRTPTGSACHAYIKIILPAQWLRLC